jgi:hypothetical protein
MTLSLHAHRHGCVAAMEERQSVIIADANEAHLNPEASSARFAKK